MATEARGRGWRVRGGYNLLWIPVLLFTLGLFVFPLVRLVELSFTDEAGGGYTLGWYERVFQQSAYLKVMLYTLIVSCVVPLLCLVVSYPVAYVMATARNRWVAGFLAAMVLVPFTTSVLVKSFAWVALLGEYGIVNRVFVALHFPGAPYPLLYNNTGVLLALTNSLAPFMILSIYSVLRGIDRNLFKAAAVAGANPFQSFTRVLLPLSMPGVSAGVLLVFIMTAGTFIVPALLGGPRQTMVGQLIEDAVQSTLSYNFASAVSVLLLLATLIVYVSGARVLNLDRIMRIGR